MHGLINYFDHDGVHLTDMYIVRISIFDKKEYVNQTDLEAFYFTVRLSALTRKADSSLLQAVQHHQAT